MQIPTGTTLEMSQKMKDPSVVFEAIGRRVGSYSKEVSVEFPRDMVITRGDQDSFLLSSSTAGCWIKMSFGERFSVTGSWLYEKASTKLDFSQAHTVVDRAAPADSTVSGVLRIGVTESKEIDLLKALNRVESLAQALYGVHNRFGTTTTGLAQTPTVSVARNLEQTIEQLSLYLIERFRELQIFTEVAKVLPDTLPLPDDAVLNLSPQVVTERGARQTIYFYAARQRLHILGQREVDNQGAIVGFGQKKLTALSLRYVEGHGEIIDSSELQKSYPLTKELLVDGSPLFEDFRQHACGCV